MVELLTVLLVRTSTYSAMPESGTKDRHDNDSYGEYHFEGDTPLHYAYLQGKTGVVRELVQHGDRVEDATYAYGRNTNSRRKR
jgi:ankyrin repeat protein